MVSTRADQITPTKPVWLWDQWLAAGNIHLLVGRQGSGKSTFAAWLVGRLTTGGPYPDDQRQHDPCSVAMLSLEEADERLVARLHATDANVSQVEILSDVDDIDRDGRPYRHRWGLPQDCSVLEDFIRVNDIRVLVVDGLGYSITGNSHDYGVVGKALSGLVDVAERTNCAILGLTHPPKGASDPVTAAIGSTAWTAIPRVVWVLGVDPTDETKQRRVCLVSKTNYRAPDNGLAFIIENNANHECGYIAGLSTSSVSADDLMAIQQTDEERTARSEAREHLKSILKDGPVDTPKVLKLMEEEGFSGTTIKRARGDLKVVPIPRRDPITGQLLPGQLRLPNQRVNPLEQPEGQPPSGPVDPLVATRAFTGSSGPEGHHTGSDPLDLVLSENGAP